MARGLPNGFTAVVFRVALEEYLVDVSRVFLRHLQQLILAGRLIIRDGRLVHVAHVVQLVTMHYELVRLVAHHVFLCPHAGGMRRIQIPVGLLRRGDDVYDRVKLRLELGIIAQLHQIRRAFHHLVEIRINEPMRPMVVGLLAYQGIRRRLQVRHAGFSFPKGEWHQHRALRL